jgi:hypothetical protein
MNVKLVDVREISDKFWKLTLIVEGLGEIRLPYYPERQSAGDISSYDGKRSYRESRLDSGFKLAVEELVKNRK